MTTKSQINVLTAQGLNHSQLKLFTITFFMVLAIVYSRPLYSQSVPETPFNVSANPSAVCPSAPYTYLKATSPGNMVRWYTVSTGGTPIGITPSGGTLKVGITQPTKFFAESLTPAGVVSKSRAVVTVGANTVPVITYVPADINTSNAPGQCGAIITYPNALATGTPAPSIIYSQNSGSNFDGGSTTVVITAVNVCATISSSFNVTINDDQSPNIIAPASISITAPHGATSIPKPFLGFATASDNCGILTTYNDAPAIFPVGNTTVTWTAVDVNNNVSHAAQLIKVRLMSNSIDPVDIVLTTTPMAERIIKIPGDNNYTSESSTLQASVFPNPFTCNLSIKLKSSTSEKVEISIYNTLGKQVGSTQQAEPNISYTINNHLSPGIYFVHATQGAKAQVIKVVKN